MFKHLLILVCCLVVFGIGYAVAQEEEFGPPPPLQGEPPEVVVVPSEGQSVYLVPGQPGLYFYGGISTGFMDMPGINLHSTVGLG
jgi:hypothetical protein